MRCLIAILVSLLPVLMIGQTLGVSKFFMDEHDLTAVNEATKFKDDNDEVCALIKIETTQKGFMFDGGTVGIAKVDDNHTSEIWVYVPAGLRRISVMHNTLGVLRNYVFPIILESGRTYIMKLETGSVEIVVKQKATSQWLVLNYEPKDAMVEIDDVIVEGDDGVVTKNLAHGKHTLRISASNYHTEVIKVEMGTEKKVLTYRLKPAFGWIEVTGPDGASVYIDNSKIGEAPIKSLPVASGAHDLRVSKEKWLPYRKQVIVNDNSVTNVSPKLIANYVTVLLKSGNNAEIWVNNVRQGGGSVSLDLTPGEYSFESRKENHRSQTIIRDITMSSGGMIEIPAPVAIVGILDINIKPVGASIFLDGKYVGESPMMIDDVLVGEHLIKSVHQGFGDEVVRVVVKEGKTCLVDKVMDKSAEVLYREALYLFDAKEYQKAAEIFRMAADFGLDSAQYSLANCYYSGKGVGQDYAKAVEWFRMAAEQGFAKAQFSLGNCYYSGKGVERNHAKAVELFRMAAEQGLARAQFSLGNCYYSGDAVEQDYAKAAEWFLKAAEQGLDRAQFSLGNCYFSGIGVVQDYAKAMGWYRKAAAQGNENARRKLKEYESYSLP